MADVVTTQYLENGNSRLVMKFTNFSDGTGEAGVKKVDATSNTNGIFQIGQNFVPGVHLVVTGIYYDVGGMRLRIQWEASSNTDMVILGGTGQPWRMRDNRAGFQGLINPKAAGATGSILFTTAGQVANSYYTVILEMLKGIPQS